MNSHFDTAPVPLLERVPLTVGTVLAGRYRLVRHVATGGMGEVWAAEDTTLHRTVAVKVLRDELAGQPEFLYRFEHEARHAASVTHPHIATLHDYGRDDATLPPRAFLVMELVDGEPLSAMLRRTPVPHIDTTVRILAQSADALAAAHRSGVVHRDVKPANILLDQDRQVHLTDFGIAGPVGDAAASTRSEVLGTPHYMSPEQARGLPVTAASDLYSLGVVAYRMLSGRLPIDGNTPAEIVDGHVHRFPAPLPDRIPAHIRGVVLSALAKDQGDRPPDAATFARVLRSGSLAAGAPVDAPTRLMPSVSDAPTGVQATELIGTAAAATTVMPATTADEADADPATPRPRFGRLFWVLAAVVAAGALALSIGSADDGQVVPGETTVPAAPTSAPDAVTQAPSTTVAPQSGPPAGKRNGNGKGKAKGKDG